VILDTEWSMKKWGGQDLAAAQRPRIAERIRSRLIAMMQVVLEYKTEATKQPCGLCGQEMTVSAGMQMVVAGNSAPVCPDCGRQHAPALTALLQLADAATRIGRIGRHSVFPPLTALLDLANAAEKYAHSAAR
jgi:hypothetical protein